MFLGWIPTEKVAEGEDAVACSQRWREAVVVRKSDKDGFAQPRYCNESTN